MNVASQNTKQKDNSRSWYDALWLRIQQEHQTQVHKLKQDKTEYSFIPQIISSLTSLNVYSCFYPSDPNPSHALPQTLPLHQPTTKQHVHQTNISKINIFCCYMKCAATLWIIFSTLTSYIVSDTTRRSDSSLMSSQSVSFWPGVNLMVPCNFHHHLRLMLHHLVKYPW